MDKYTKDDTFLARWLANQLSDEELKDFEKTEAYKEFSAINKVAKSLSGPTIDTEKALEKVKKRLTVPKKTKVFKLWMSVAASIALLVGTYAFLQSSVTYSTTVGQKRDITLADGSVINLNSNSSISHKRFFWKSNKSLILNKGEAYFTVTKGEGFYVDTHHGKVSVLGTQFNIKTSHTQTQVKCYTGKVSFDRNNETSILTKGLIFTAFTNDSRVIKDQFKEKTPDWKNGYSSYKNQEFSVILSELENYYPIRIENKKNFSQRYFSGTFTHNNLDQALQTTLGAMNIKYQLASDGVTLIISE